MPVLSDTPGRLRVRLPDHQREAEFVHGLHSHLLAAGGVDVVESRPEAGSVTVRYRPDQRSSKELLGLLEAAGVEFGDRPQLDEPPDEASAAATGLMQAVTGLDSAIARATGRSVDLRILVPAALGAFGAYKLVREGPRFERVPPYVLLWYAFDSFWKLHADRHAPGKDAGHHHSHHDDDRSDNDGDDA